MPRHATPGHNSTSNHFITLHATTPLAFATKHDKTSYRTARHNTARLRLATRRRDNTAIQASTSVHITSQQNTNKTQHISTTYQLKEPRDTTSLVFTPLHDVVNPKHSTPILAFATKHDKTSYRTARHNTPRLHFITRHRTPTPKRNAARLHYKTCQNKPNQSSDLS